jgi:antitoxin component YwqK of YwqJK toxin-antitoxin module
MMSTIEAHNLKEQEIDPSFDHKRVGYYNQQKQITKVIYYYPEQTLFQNPDNGKDAPLLEKIPAGEYEFKYVRLVQPLIEKIIAETDENAVFHGKYSEFSKNKTPTCIGQYEHGLKTGVWKTFKENGDLSAEFTFADDAPVQGTIYGEEGSNPEAYDSNEAYSVLWKIFPENPGINVGNALELKRN